MKKSNTIGLLAKKYPVLLIVLGGLFFRLLVAVLYQHITFYPDSVGYFELADRLLHFDLQDYEGQRSPGYPLLLAIAGMSELAVVLLQWVAGIATLVVLYKILFFLKIRQSYALLFTLFTAAYLPAVFFDFALLTESLTLLVVISAFYQFFRILKNENKRYSYLLLLILCSYLVLIKTFYVFLPVVLSIILLLEHKSLKKILGLVLLPFIVFFGWSYVNKLNTGHFVSTTYYGFNLAQNCVSFAENTIPEYQEIGDIYAKYREANDTSRYEVAMTIWQAYPELKRETGLSFPDLSKQLYDYSIATIKENPLAYAKQVFISWADFWKTSLYWEYESFAISEGAIVLKYVCYGERILLQLVKLIFLLFVPLHLYRFVRSKKFSVQMTITLVVLVASILQAVVTYGTNSRFSFPFEFLILVSVWLDYMEYRRRKKERS